MAHVLNHTFVSLFFRSYFVEISTKIAYFVSHKIRLLHPHSFRVVRHRYFAAMKLLARKNHGFWRIRKLYERWECKMNSGEDEGCALILWKRLNFTTVLLYTKSLGILLKSSSEFSLLSLKKILSHNRIPEMQTRNKKLSLNAYKNR